MGRAMGHIHSPVDWYRDSGARDCDALVVRA